MPVTVEVLVGQVVPVLILDFVDPLCNQGDGSLKSLVVSADFVGATVVANTINFSFNRLNISLSVLTGAFNYETSRFQRYLNNRLLGGGSTKGSRLCKVNTGTKHF